jgi:hypothetical protein
MARPRAPRPLEVAVPLLTRCSGLTGEKATTSTSRPSFSRPACCSSAPGAGHCHRRAGRPRSVRGRQATPAGASGWPGCRSDSHALVPLPRLRQSAFHQRRNLPPPC